MFDNRMTRTKKGHLTSLFAIGRALCRHAVQQNFDGPYAEWHAYEEGLVR